MEFGGSKFLHSLVLGTLIALSHVLTFVKMEDDKTWTFNIPGVSFISFSPIYTNTQNQHISLNFRTRNPNSLIFCHYLKDLDVKELERINYKMCGELQYGLFVLNYRLAQFQDDGLTLGKALHNDQWHKVDIFLDTSTGELIVKVDQEKRVTSLKSYTRQDVTSLLDWSKHSSAIYFGGTDPDTLFSDIYPHFIGCMSDIRYLNKNRGHVAIPVGMLEGVVEGCTDTCTSNPCHHGGNCVNTYVAATCDCFSTDYQGEFCSDLGPTTLTLRGYEWLTYSMYKQDENILTDKIRFSLEFKTSRGSGVLFYAVGGTPYHSHVTASVHAGEVHVSMAFNDEDIEVQAGIGLDDYRWHNLTILHDNRTVYVYVDGREHTRNITGNTHHLGLDPKVFVGGGDNFVVTRGLQVTQNFVGCLKNVYINAVSLLYEMYEGDQAVTYHGGGSTAPHYVCEEVVNIPISFPSSASQLILDTTSDMGRDFEIEFDFKTVRSEALMLYLSLDDTDTSIEYNYGYIEVWLMKGQPYLKFVPSTLHMERSEHLYIPTLVNNNVWHTMHVSYQNRHVKLKVNGISVATTESRSTMEITDKIVVGYGFNTYKNSEGYVGCIRNLKYGGKLLDALDLLETQSATGLIIDGCNITDYCRDNSMCEHGGKCLSEWTGVDCDCSETNYTGRACHFSKYKRTCDEYYQSGVKRSGVRLIDLDGSGPIQPAPVQCTMGYESGLEFFGKTIVTHNFMSNTTVRRSMMQDMRTIITYREMNREQLIRLTEESAWCEQSIQYHCIHSPIRLGTLTWFKAANGEMVEYLGREDGKPGFCTCSLDDSCTADRCNCDNKTMTLQHDVGYNRVNHQLPLLEMTIKQDSNPLNPGTANMTLGPLVCWGNNDQLAANAVTFGSEAGYLLSHPWKSGVMMVSFRSHHSQAIILYQTGFKENINYFFVALTSETTMKIFFRWGLKKLEVEITSPQVISDGQWHQVTIETDQFNVRCILDMTEKISAIPDGVPMVTAFSGILYIGGLPDSVSKDSSLTDINGIVGCMRGLHYNNKQYPLSDLIDTTTRDVMKECMASCWPNPCLNGAMCVEEWGAHQCTCVNKWAHSGHNCEIDINMDAVTFSGESFSYLHFEKPVNTRLLDSTIIFSFRTFKKNTLLLYLHDNYNNFIQVELKDGKNVIANFNRLNTIFEQTKTVTGNLDDGSWNQVVIDNFDGYIKVVVNVDEDKTRNSYRRKSLETYESSPFAQDEKVVPVRASVAPTPALHVYVGGVPADMSSYPTLHGCIRGLKIGDHVFPLQETATQTSGVTPLCKDGCEDKPCKHEGICEERWQDRQFTCDCTYSEYAGPRCNTEASGKFDSQSILEYKYDPPRTAQQTTTERLELIFRVSGDVKTNMILVFIYSERYYTHDFLVVYLDPHNGVYINANQGYSIYGVGKPGSFADGKPHQLVYERKNSEMILTVRNENHPKYRHKTISLDEEGIGRVASSDNALDELDTIMIGGIEWATFQDIPELSDYVKYSNFTGCLSDVTFYPRGDLPRDPSLELRPLKDLRDGLNSSGMVRTVGPEIKGCSTQYKPKFVTTTTTPAPTMAPTDEPAYTFPPWNPGPAEIIWIGTPPVLPTSPTTTNKTTPTTSTERKKDIAYGSKEQGRHEDTIVIITLSLVAFLLIVALLIAIILVRARRREKKKEEKKKNEVLEMKQPLNDVDVAVAIADNHQNQNYLARLDEFSMISATLGARPVKSDEMTTFKPVPSESSCAYSSVPQSEDDAPTVQEQRFYNRKKNRPASSISEVLEEMERQRNVKDADPEDLETLGTGPLQQQIPGETTPLTCPNEDFRHMLPIEEDFIYTMLPPPPRGEMKYPQDGDHTHSDSLSSTEVENHEDDVSNDADNESDSPSPPPPIHVGSFGGEYNGDSGYEAESKPDEEEDETLMNDSDHDDHSYQGEVTPHTPDSHTYNVYSEGNSPPSLDSKNSNYLSNNVSPLSHSDNMSSGNNVSPPTTPDSKVVTYGFPTPVIDNVVDFLPRKPSVITNGADDT